jgi:hypothetical protein
MKMGLSLKVNIEMELHVIQPAFGVQETSWKM